jgi:uncharacterized SAM-binding protein YcdF (DUF218 family)
MSSYLNNSDEPEKVEALIVLGGSPTDRGERAAELYHDGICMENLYCTGGYIVSALQAFKIDVHESGLSKNVMLENGVPEELITELQNSTSTYEEALEILSLARRKEWKKIGVVTSEYHIRRTRWTFEEVFESQDASIEVLFFASDSERYKADAWWTHEESFLLTFSEYMKLFYYLMSY